MKYISASVLAVLLLLNGGSVRAEVTEIKVGIFTTDPQRITEEGDVMEYISKKVGAKFILVPIIGYEKSVEKLADGVIDAAILGSAPSYISESKGIAEAIARPEARKSSVYYGYWMTLKETGLKTVEDFKGKKFAYVDPYTSAGYLFPRAVLKEKGFDPEKFFGTVKYSNTHEAAIQMLLNRSVDGCAAKDTAYRKFIETNISLKDRIHIIETGGPFPERTLMISRKIDESLRKKVKDLLLKMDSDPEGKKLLVRIGRERYVETKKEDFAAIEKTLRILGEGYK